MEEKKWLAEINLKNNAKIHTCYIDPSKEHKINSKTEELHYLRSIESIPQPKGKKRSSRHCPSLDVDEKILDSCPETAGGGEETSALDQKEKNKILKSPPQNSPEVKKTGNERRQVTNNNNLKNCDKKSEARRGPLKRLGGVKVDSIPELRPNKRTHHVSTRLVDNTDAAPTATADSLVQLTTTISGEDNKHDCASDGCSVPKVDNLSMETSNDKRDDVVAPSLEIPLNDFLVDPCLEFAIKTLTGQIPIEEALENPTGAADIQKSSIESSFGDLWGDPCIDFAVKTLIGDIPLHDPFFQNNFQKLDKGSGSVSRCDGSLTSGFPQNGNQDLQKAGDGNDCFNYRL